MKAVLKIDPEKFGRAIAAIGNIVPSRPSMPDLANFIIRRDKERGIFTLTASDNDSLLVLDCVTYTTDSEGNTVMEKYVDIAEEDEREPFESVSINWADTKNIINTLPKSMILRATIVLDGESGEMDVNYNVGNFSLPVRSTATFPLIPDVVTEEGNPNGIQPVCTMQIPAGKSLVKYISQASGCTGNDELSQQMSCVALDCSIEQITVVASDGHKLYRRILPLGAGYMTRKFFPADQTHIALVPKNAVRTLSAVNKDDGEMTVSVDSQRISWVGKTFKLISRQVESRYPNYAAVIPTSHEWSVTLDAQGLRTALGRLGLFWSVTSLVTLKRSGNEIILKAEDIDFGKKASEKVAILNEDCQLPENEVYGLKGSVLSLLLGIISTDNATFHLDEINKPVIIQEDVNNPDLTLLQMPMLING